MSEEERGKERRKWPRVLGVMEKGSESFCDGQRDRWKEGDIEGDTEIRRERVSAL